MKTAIYGFLFVFLLSSSMLVTAQSYTITDLGVLKGDNESSGFWINNNGDVVGCSDTETSEGYPCTGTVSGQHAFLWTKSGGLKDLGTLSGATISGAIGINDANVVVGYSNVKGKPATNFVAVQWSGSGAITNLGTLSGGSSSAAFEINSAGEIAGDSFLSSGVVDATSWTSNKIKSLGALPGAIFTAGLDINEGGHVVGESVFSYGPPFISHAFVWNGAAMKDLGTLPGGTSSIANSINSNGAIAGQSNGSSTGVNWHAVKWNTGHVIQDLGVLSRGTYSIGFAINDPGTIVGYANTYTNAAHAILWTESKGMQDLNSLIPVNSGWVLVNANAINNVGQITGYGIKNGKNHAFVLTPTD